MIEQLAKELFTNVKAKADQFSDIKDMPESQFRVLLESAMRKLNMVSREEFDAQSAVLLRTREKLEALEKQFEQIKDELQPRNS